MESGLGRHRREGGNWVAAGCRVASPERSRRALAARQCPMLDKYGWGTQDIDKPDAHQLVIIPDTLGNHYIAH